MAFARATIFRTMVGDRRCHYGTATWANADVNGTLETELDVVDSLILPHLIEYVPTGGSCAIKFEDPGANAGTVSWMAFGR